MIGDQTLAYSVGNGRAGLFPSAPNGRTGWDLSTKHLPVRLLVEQVGFPQHRHGYAQFFSQHIPQLVKSGFAPCRDRELKDAAEKDEIGA